MLRRCLTALGIAGVAFICGTCESGALESVSGRHATLHWSAEEHQLCGGTLRYIDASLEAVASTYGVSLPAQPAFDIFWTRDLTLAQNICVTLAHDCVLPFRNGTKVMASESAIQAHELTHLVSPAGPKRNLPAFFSEGVAVRWEHGWEDASSGKEIYIGNIKYSKLLELLQSRSRLDPDAYSEAGFFWSWLEAEYGPSRMAGFALEIHRTMSVEEVESAFERNFGLSLEEAAEASTGQPMFMFDIHACSMPDLPELSWQSESLTLSDGPVDCTDKTVVNSGEGAVRLVRLHMPDAPSEYRVTVDDDSPSSVRLYACTGIPRPYAITPYFGGLLNYGPITLSGEYIAVMSASIDADGVVRFPTATLEIL